MQSAWRPGYHSERTRLCRGAYTLTTTLTLILMDVLSCLHTHDSIRYSKHLCGIAERSNPSESVRHNQRKKHREYKLQPEKERENESYSQTKTHTHTHIRMCACLEGSKLGDSNRVEYSQTWHLPLHLGRGSSSWPHHEAPCRMLASNRR